MYHYNPRYRYHVIRDHALLVSPLTRGLAGTAGLATIISWLIIIFFSTAPWAIAVATISTSLCTGVLLALIYGATYYPYLPPDRTVHQLVSRVRPAQPVNVAAAASFTLLASLGRQSRGDEEKSLRLCTNSLIYSPYLKHLLRRLQLDAQQTAVAVSEHAIPELTWADFAQDMLSVASHLRAESITPAHAWGALMLRPQLQAYLRQHNLTEKDIHFALWWESARIASVRAAQRWWDENNLLAFSGIGLSWAAGYTPFVDRFARIPRGSVWDDSIFGHEEKLETLINSLARQRQSNVLVAGDPGAGQLGIIRHLAARIQAGTAHRALRGERVIYINVGELVAQASSDASQLAVVSHALGEMERAGNIIAVLDGLSSVLGRSGEERLDLTDILIPFLSSRTVRVVVMTSLADYHLRLKSNDQLNQYFEVVVVLSLSVEATLQRLALSLPAIEHAARLFIPYQTIRSVVEDTASLLPHVPFPERAFDFLEEAIVTAQGASARQLLPEHVHKVIARKVGVNIGSLKKREKEQLLNLEALMHERLINQEKAVKALARAMIRARAEIRRTDRPIGTFLFLGPTGVGKTETAKTLAYAYFGSADHMIRLDMSEFQGADAVSRLIGSAANPVGRLTSLIAEHPFTVLLLDEFEKADERVHQLFLQVLDEGHLTDASGRHFSFQHAIIIATSNAGAELIRRHTKNGQIPEGFENTLKDHILEQNILRPELLNRFDAVITYTPLTPDHIRQVARLMLRALNQRLDAEHGVTVAVTDEVIDYLVSIGYHPEFGARPMARA
ncbi:MAG TPA: AAA family ATPase, partial [Candidatus Andersenbacteria bacterium]|nr:AAA family ATPase [Candidatus Andersenbacteria bacterium]